MTVYLLLVGVLLAGLISALAAWSFTCQPRYKRTK